MIASIPLSIRLTVVLVLTSLVGTCAPVVASESQQKRRRRPVPRCAGTVCTGVSASRQRLEVGDRVVLRANAVNVDGDELTYRWETTGGRILGAGAEVQFESTGLAPGRYSVTAFVEDGFNPPTECSVDLEVVPLGTP